MRNPWGMAAIGALVWTGAASAQDTAPAPKPSDKTNTNVTVTARRAEVTNRIDRRVYDVKNNPQAGTGTIDDLLKTLPLVTVAPDGTVSLRGDANVSITIDDKAPPDGNLTLKTFPANRIDRIEIITNPSAQYSASGSGGIINIITKKSHPLGLSGGATSDFDSLGNGSAGATIDLTRGRLTLGAGLDGNRNASTASNRLHQQTFGTLGDTFGAPAETMDQLTHERFGGTYGGGNARAAYKLTDHATLSLNASGGSGHSLGESLMQVTASDGNFTEVSHGGDRYNYHGADGLYAYTGDHDGETLKIGANSLVNEGSGTRAFSDIFAAPGQPAQTTTSLNSATIDTDTVFANYERGFGGTTMLTAGASWARRGVRQLRLQSSTDPAQGSYSDPFTAAEITTSAYVTYQFPLGRWTLLPGLRVEGDTRRYASGAQSETDLFPTLHLSHDLGAKGKFKLSYSNRIDRPGLEQNDPAVIWFSAKGAFAGNPDLKPQRVDSYEASYDYSDKAFNSVLLVYYRQTQHDFTTLYRDLGDGVLLSTLVNAGHSWTGGADASFRGPIAAHWKYTYDFNLFANEVPPLGAGAVARTDLTWTSTGTLEYDSRPNAPDGEQLQFTLNAAGRQLTPQGSMGGQITVDANYRHPLTKKWALVVSVVDLFNGSARRSTIDTPLIRQRTLFTYHRQALKIALSWKFGAQP